MGQVLSISFLKFVWYLAWITQSYSAFLPHFLSFPLWFSSWLWNLSNTAQDKAISSIFFYIQLIRFNLTYSEMKLKFRLISYAGKIYEKFMHTSIRKFGCYHSYHSLIQHFLSPSLQETFYQGRSNTISSYQSSPKSTASIQRTLSSLQKPKRSEDGEEKKPKRYDFCWAQEEAETEITRDAQSAKTW